MECQQVAPHDRVVTLESLIAFLFETPGPKKKPYEDES
jgi:hypothetical protein